MNYPPLFMELSHYIYQHVQQYRNHPEYNRVWGASVITDVIANSILQSPDSVKRAKELAQ